MSDEKAHAGSVGVGIGPIAEPTVESQEPASTVQQEPASSSSDIAPPMPTQNLQDERMDSPMELDAQECRESKGARPSETPTSEISGRPVVKARSGTVVLSTPASSSKDKMMIGGLFVNGINVVATLVPEENE